MTNLCIIPARGGSKRIPRKNIKEFQGKPIIAYSIEAALSSKLFHEVMVSTDDHEIAAIAQKFGAEVPFYRSEVAANDYATTLDVLKEVVLAYQSKGVSFDFVCCIYPTAPFVTSERIIQGFELISQQQLESVFSVSRFEYPVQRCLVKNESSELSYLYPEFTNTRSQDLTPAYHDAGQWYWIESSFLNATDKITGKTLGVELDPLEVQDIDNPEDWHIAEFKYAYLQSIK